MRMSQLLGKISMRETRLLFHLGSSLSIFLAWSHGNLHTLNKVIEGTWIRPVLNPLTSWSGPPPQTRIRDNNSRPVTITIFRPDKQNSSSPKNLIPFLRVSRVQRFGNRVNYVIVGIPNIFIPKITTRNIAIQTPGLTISRGTQYSRTRAAAVNCVGGRIKYLNQ